jgi:uncharacterized protein
MSSLTVTDRTRHRRIPMRGTHELETVFRILDEALICHVGFATEQGPFVIPTIHCRIDDRLYLHGSPAARIFRGGPAGIDLCVTVTLLDGLVLARSAFHHSMNYRSAMIFGRGRIVEDGAEKREALDALVEQVVAGRGAGSRGPNEKEVRQTAVLVLPIDEASAKIREGGPNDDAEDMDGPHWAGVIPLRIVAGDPIPDPKLKPGIETPGYAKHYTRTGWAEPSGVTEG